MEHARADGTVLFLAAATILITMVPAGGSAQDAPTYDFADVDLNELLDQKVVTATKTEQRATEAPANIVIITAEEMERAGCRTVAEALELLPGLASNTDHVFTNVGVRGTSGGLRSGSRHIKVLVDGHPVAFRPDAQNLLGLEMIPIGAIARIEVIRGPASALYGRDAFLGVVQVVTKRAAKEAAPAEGDSDETTDTAATGHHAEYAARARLGTIREGMNTDGELVISDRVRRVSFTLAGFVGREDRSGQFLPRNALQSEQFGGNDLSRQDLAQPFSLFGRVELDASAGGRLTLHGLLQNLDSSGEFLDYGALSHKTRINLRNGFVRLSYLLPLGRVELDLHAALSARGNGPNDVILPMINGQPLGQTVRREFGYRELEAGLETRLSLLQRSSLLAGVEYSHDLEHTRTNVFVSADGQETRGRDQGDHAFDDVGVYGQALMSELKWLLLAANLRYDHHNQFGGNLNYRGAAVLTPWHSVYCKLMVGTSYRAPTPEQLFGTSVRPGDAEGVVASGGGAHLLPQTASVQEISLGTSQKRYAVQLDAYHIWVGNRIEYLVREGNLEPANLADSDSYGAELSVAVRSPRLWQRLNLGIKASFSYDRTDISVGAERDPWLTPREHDLLQTHEIYPGWMVKWALDVALPRTFVNLQLRMNIIGRRLESQVNQTLGRPFVDSPDLALPVSYPVDLAITSVGLKLWGQRSTRLQLVANDIFNTSSPEPGFNGFQIPSLGRRVMLSLYQEL